MRPRSASAVKKNGHALAPSPPCQLSPAHVSCPTSPGWATESNSHKLAPLRTSKARAFPMPPMVPGGVLAPTTATWRKTSGTEL